MGNPFEALRSVRPEQFVKPARVALGALAVTATLNFSDGRVPNATAQPEDSPNLNTSNFSLNEDQQYCIQGDSEKGMSIKSLTYVQNKKTGEYSFWPNGCPPEDYLIIRSQLFVANVPVNSNLAGSQGK